MQSHGITLSFHREMADSSRELVGPDITAAVTFERYPRFIKGGFQDYEGLGIKRSTADSKHVSLHTIKVARKHRVLKSPPQSSRIFGINRPLWPVPDGRATTDPRWNCGQSLSSERPRIAFGWGAAGLPASKRAPALRNGDSHVASRSAATNWEKAKVPGAGSGFP